MKCAAKGAGERSRLERRRAPEDFPRHLAVKVPFEVETDLRGRRARAAADGIVAGREITPT